MPAGNNTGSNSDYRVSDPPYQPMVSAGLKTASLGITAACFGAALAAFACLATHRRPLAMLGFLVAFVGIGIAYAGLRKVRAALNTWGTPRKLLAAGERALGPMRQDADIACGGVAKGVLYELQAGEKHLCPEEWPAPCTVEFLKGGDVVASAVLWTSKCDVCLTESEVKTIPPTYAIVLTPLA